MPEDRSEIPRFRPLTAPFRFRQSVAGPDSSWDWIPFFNLALLLIVFGFIRNEFVFPPGVAIDLPRSSSGELVIGRPAAVVLTVQTGGGDEDAIVLVRGRILPLARLEGFLLALTAADPSLADSHALLKADRSVPSHVILTVCEAVGQAGFRGVQLAVEPAAEMPRR